MKKVFIFIGFAMLPFLSFSQAKSAGQVVDIDKNIYNTVVIGNQVWLKENLKVTKFNNGDPIQLETDTLAWTKLTTPAYCNYENNERIAQEYGRLYNYFTVVDDRKLCPTGWHVPSDTEWDVLVDYLGGFKVAGAKMKEAGTKHWRSPNIMFIDSTNGNSNEIQLNSCGFNALPAGRNYHEYYIFLGEYAQFWSTTKSELDENLIWCRYLSFSLPNLNRFTYGSYYGLSVRCLKD